LQDAAPQPDQDAEADSQPPAVPTETDRPAQKPPVEADAYLAGLDKKQVELRITRTELLLQYTEQHPDVMQVDRQLEQLRIERHRYLQQLKKN
jgi:serine/threonine-protein kinase